MCAGTSGRSKTRQLIPVSAGGAQPNEPGGGDFEVARQRREVGQSQPEQRLRQRGAGEEGPELILGWLLGL